jgi:sugar phosphate isomerase/epimerase
MQSIKPKFRIGFPYNETQKGIFIMKISVSVTMRTLETLGGIEAGFKALHDAGFEAIEFAFDTTDVNWEEMRAAKPSHLYDDDVFWPQAKAIKEAAEKYDIAIDQCHAPMPSFISGCPECNVLLKKYTEKAIEFCGYCGVKNVIVHPCFDGSYRFPKLTRADELALNIEFYSSLIPLLQKNNVVCCLENMFTQDWKSKKIFLACCSDMRDSVYYIDELNKIAGEERFGFCLDIGHLLLLGLDAKNAMETLGSRLKALHIHDNDGVEDRHIAAYLGLTNWDRFLAGLRMVGYEGNINFETGGSHAQVPADLMPSMLKLIADTGHYFRKRLTTPLKPRD